MSQIALTLGKIKKHKQECTLNNKAMVIVLSDKCYFFFDPTGREQWKIASPVLRIEPVVGNRDIVLYVLCLSFFTA